MNSEKNKIIPIIVTQAEKDLLESVAKKREEKNLSDYARKVLFTDALEMNNSIKHDEAKTKDDDFTNKMLRKIFVLLLRMATKTLKKEEIDDAIKKADNSKNKE